MTTVTDSKLIERIIFQMLTDEPYYGALIQQFKISLSRQVPTAGVRFDQNGKSICLAVNPDYFESLPSDKERVSLLKHECAHVDRLHLMRFREYEDFRTANKAMDLAINCYIPNLPEGGLYPKEYGLRDYMPAEWYYERILNEKAPKQPKGGKGKGKGKGDQQASGSGDGEDEGEQDETGSGGGSQPGDQQGEGDGKGKKIVKHYVPEGQTDVHDWDDQGLSKDEQIDIIEACLKRAMEKLGQGADSCPAHVQEALEALKEMRVKNWHKELKKFLGSTVHGWDIERTWSRRNRRYGLQDAGSKSGNGKKLVVAFDVSGSMSVTEIQRALAETQSMVKRGVVGTLMIFDTEVRMKKDLRSVKSETLEIDGGGGTAFQDVFEKADQMRADGIVIFTDMDDSGLVEQPKTPVMWVLTDGERTKYDWGHKVLLDK